MNSYNENLQASVIASLSAQELDLTNASSQLDASTYSLYYAQEARITAEEKLNATNEQYTDAGNLQKAAVENNNLAINLVDSANQSKNNVAQAVNNVAVGAANIQVAANAILSLASDVGGILNIASAANFDSQIFAQAEDASDYIKDTAYDAEIASQMAMEASNLTAQVSSTTVATEATAAGASMQTMLDTLSAQFNTTAASLSANTVALSAASDAEKKTEGELEDYNVEYYATESAYRLTSKELNLGINVPQSSKTNTQYTVRFNALTSPYPKTKITAADLVDPSTAQLSSYPVDNYYLFLVKSEQSKTFSIAAAEAIIEDGVNEKKKFLEVPMDSAMFDADGTAFYEQPIFITDLNDTEGQSLNLGDNYTIFLCAYLDNFYQKTLNNFENFIAAPSAEFNIVNQLVSANPNNIKINGHSLEIPLVDGVKTDIPIVYPGRPITTITADIYMDNNFFDDVDFRLLLLPNQCDLIQGLLTSAELRELEDEVESLEKIADEYDPQIAALQEEITSLEASISSLNEQQPEPTAADAEPTEIDMQTTAKNTKLTAAQSALATVEQNKADAEAQFDPNFHSKPGFFFNTMLAEQVPAGSYLNPSEAPTIPDIALRSGEHTGKYKVSVKFTLTDTTTDNFGNSLVETDYYIPAILVIINDSNPNPDQFVSALSDFENTGHFIFNQS